MASLYLFAVLVGGGLLALSLTGGDSGSELELDSGSDAFRWLSLRNVSYFLFVFGGVGAALARFSANLGALSIALIAVLAGLAVAAAVAAAFGYLQRSDSGDSVGDAGLIGRAGTLILPFGETGLGKVQLHGAGRTVELIARPFRSTEGDPATWRDVVVIAMDGSTALVAPASTMLPGEQS